MIKLSFNEWNLSLLVKADSRQYFKGECIEISEVNNMLHWMYITPVHQWSLPLKPLHLILYIAHVIHVSQKTAHACFVSLSWIRYGWLLKWSNLSLVRITSFWFVVNDLVGDCILKWSLDDNLKATGMIPVRGDLVIEDVGTYRSYYQGDLELSCTRRLVVAITL